MPARRLPLRKTREILRLLWHLGFGVRQAAPDSALLLNASGLVLFHTHPSGDPAPSTEDLAFTRRLSEAGELVGVKLLDHMILGSAGRWVSLGRRGAW